MCYPVVLVPAGKGFTVFVPDLDIGTQGDNREEAMAMARDVITCCNADLLEMGEPIPPPSATAPPHNPGETIAWVSIDAVTMRPAS